jgi:hypothetical protein
VTRNVPARALSAGLASFAPSVARHEIRTTGVRGLIPVHVAGEPDVLVSRTESDALKRLLARAQQGSVDLAPLLESVPEEIAIPSIVIDTLEPVSGEGVRQ